MIAVFESSRWMRETSGEDVEIGYGFVADAMIGIDFSDLASDDVVGVLHVDALGKTRDHD